MKRTVDQVSPAEIADGLRKAKALIDHPKKWLQFRFEDRRTKPPRICAHRAMETIGGSLVAPLHLAMVKAFVGKAAPHDDQFLSTTQQQVCAINNKIDHDELMARFDKAIAKQERTTILSGG